MKTEFIASTLRAAADELDGERPVKDIIDELLSRTGKAEDLLSVLADLYAEKAKTEQYADSIDQMGQTEQLLRVASRAIAEVWES